MRGGGGETTYGGGEEELTKRDWPGQQETLRVCRMKCWEGEVPDTHYQRFAATV